MKGWALLLAVWPAIALAEPFSFKEFKLDATREEMMAARPGMRCQDGPLPVADHTCSLVYETIAGKEVQLLSVTFYDDHASIIRLLIQHSDFNNVVDALTERYGKPHSSETAQYANQLGAKFDRRTVRWLGDRSRIEAREYGGRIDRSVIEFIMNDSIEKFRVRRDRARSGAAKDL